MSKQIIPIAPGRLELRYQGQLVGYAVDQSEAQTRLSEIAYDAERGRPLPLVEAPSEPSSYPLPPAALIAQLLSYPEYRMRNEHIAYVAAGPYPDADPRTRCTGATSNARSG